MAQAPKYAMFEIERRWLVDPANVPALDESRRVDIEDRYVEGTRLRLRRMHSAAAGTVFKFCKKYGGRNAGIEPITNLYLTHQEYDQLSNLPGHFVRKRRYHLDQGAIDLYDPALSVVVFEIEFANEAAALAYRPPAFVGREITDDADFSGAALAATSAAGRIPGESGTGW